MDWFWTKFQFLLIVLIRFVLFGLRYLGKVKVSYGASGREEGCSNRQSAVIWEMGNLAKSSYNFYSGWKSL